MLNPLIEIGDMLIVCAAALVFAWMWFHRPSTRGQLHSRDDRQLDARLDRIEAAVSAMALETERIAEGQRFTTKLLSKIDVPPERIVSSR